jgi:hypothetical protein
VSTEAMTSRVDALLCRGSWKCLFVSLLLRIRYGYEYKSTVTLFQSRKPLSVKYLEDRVLLQFNGLFPDPPSQTEKKTTDRTIKKLRL